MKRRKYRKLAKRQQKKKRERFKSLGGHLGLISKSTRQRGKWHINKNQTKMEYSVEDIYKFIGRDDKVALFTFHPDSEAYNSYGYSLTVSIIYGVKEREGLEAQYKEKSSTKTFGYVKVKPLVEKLNEEQTNALKEQGIFSRDIQSIFSSQWATENPFYQEEKRILNKIEIPIRKEPKGGDYDWMYGFNKQLISDGVILIPDSMDFYLAMKMFYEPDEISEEEHILIHENGNVKTNIERKFLEIKIEKEISSKDEEERFFELTKIHSTANLEILKQELERAGTNLSELYTTNAGLFYHLLKGTYQYIPEQLNGFKGRPIYLDWKGYIHIFTRHVEEFSVGERFADKGKLLWHPSDVIPVMKNVIMKVDDEIQEFWQEHPSSRYSKYGIESLYFKGDYYTFHVEADGTVSTFHCIKKRI
jgi:hypothetical protein